MTNGPALIHLSARWADMQIDCRLFVAGRRHDVAEGKTRTGPWRRRSPETVINDRLSDLGSVLSESDGLAASAAQHRVARALDFADAPVNARLAAALALAEQAFRGSKHAETRGFEDLLDHMWTWMTVTPETFGDWHEWTSPLLSRLTDGPTQGATPSEEEFSRLGRSLIHLVYGHLFAAVIHPISLYDLHEVALVGEQRRVTLPAAGEVVPAFSGEGPADWGSDLNAAEVDELRRRLVGE